MCFTQKGKGKTKRKTEEQERGRDGESEEQREEGRERGREGWWSLEKTCHWKRSLFTSTQVPSRT